MRKNLKLSLTLVLAIVMLCAAAVIASAETTLIASGNIGKTEADAVVWEYTKDTVTGKFTLTFSGKGKIASFATPQDSPIYTYREKIDYLVIEDGITEIGQNACYGMKKVATIVIPDSVATIGKTAFRYCSGVKDFYMGTGVKSINADAFTPRNTSMKVHVKDLAAWCNIDFNTKYSNPVAGGSRAMYMDGVKVETLVIPAEVTAIKKFAFYCNTGLANVYLHDNIKTIGAFAFGNATKLRYLYVDNCTFAASSGAFYNCTYLRYVYINNIKAWVGNTWAEVNSNPLYNNVAYAYINGEGFVYTQSASKLTPKPIVIPKGTEVMNARAFYNRKEVSYIVIPETVTTINGEPLSYVTNGTSTFRYIYGVKGSAAETYASKKSQYRFKELGVDLEFIDVTDITVDQEDQTLALGGTITAKATIAPKGATDKHVIWTSSDLDVVRVSAGKVMAIGAGTATITASTTDGTVSDSFVVTVPDIAVTGIELDVAEATLTMGHTLTINATVTPADATNVTIAWTTSNKNVATVKNGVVTPVAGGTATITATVGEFSASCVVTVDVPTIEVTGITLNETAVLLAPGEVTKLVATVTPDNATDATVTWSTSNGAVATVVEGVVTAVADGEATITAKAGNFSATCTIKVETPVIEVTGITLDTDAAVLAPAETLQLTATVTPADATDATVTWTSKNTAVATVENGLVTAVADGIAVIEAKAGNFTAECTITVESPVEEYIPVEEILFDVEEIELAIGDEYNFEVIFTPEDATDKSLYWESSDEEVATIEDGKLVALAEGFTIITVISLDNEDAYAECFVTVSPAVSVTGVTLNKTNASVLVGDTVSLVATVEPADAANKNVTWSTSNDAVATVDANGVVTAVASGVATITVTTEDGEFTATCKIVVSAGNELPALPWNR